MTGEQPNPPEPKPKLRRWRRALAAVGIETSPAARWYVQLKRRFFVVVGIGCAVGVVALAGLTMYSTSPSFCRSCHIMEPYYQAWSKSKHKDVACVECHYPPGEASTILWKKFQALSQVVKFVTRTYSSKPYAEVEDASCLRSACHSTRLLKGRVITQKGVLFDHKPHLEGVRYGRQLRCASCHSQIVVGKHIEVTWDTCFLCHFKKPAAVVTTGAGGTTPGSEAPVAVTPSGPATPPDGAHATPAAAGGDPHSLGCLSCHLLPDREIKVGNITYNHKAFLKSRDIPCRSCHLDVTRGAGEVSDDRCLPCHNQPEKLARIKEVDFLHANHVTKHNTACFRCHREIKHGATAAGTKPLTYECSACHTDMHDVQRNFYRGAGALGVLPMPSPMYLSNVDCVGCHLEKKTYNHESRAQTTVGSEEGCLKCHGKEYLGILGRTNELMTATVARLNEKLQPLREAAAAAGAPRDPEVSAILQEATHNLGLVASAHPVHNIYYASQILRSVDERLTDAGKRLKAKPMDLTELPVISGGFCATLCHQNVGVKVPAEKVTWQGRVVPHQKEHVESGQPCTACHVFGSHKDVRLRKDADCKGCHEGDKLPKW